MPVWEVRVEKPSLWAIVFKYFQQFKGKNIGQAPFFTFAQRLYNSYNLPWARPAHISESGPLAPLQVPLTKSKKEKIIESEAKNYREHSNIKSKCVCALTGSVPRKMATERQKDSAQCSNRTNVTRLSTTSLNHSAIGSYEFAEKNSI